MVFISMHTYQLSCDIFKCLLYTTVREVTSIFERWANQQRKYKFVLRPVFDDLGFLKTQWYLSTDMWEHYESIVWNCEVCFKLHAMSVISFRESVLLHSQMLYKREYQKMCHVNVEAWNSVNSVKSVFFFNSWVIICVMWY